MLDKNQFDMNRIPYFICIGTMRNKIDMLAPCIGTILKRAGFNVLGTEDDALHALNLEQRFEEIKNIDDKLYQIIGVDASISNIKARITNTPLMPGSALGRELPPIGESAIKVTINDELPVEQQLEILRNEHEQYEHLTRILAAEVAHEIMNIYNYPYGRSNKHLRAIHTAKLILLGNTYRDIEAIEGYGRSTACNDVRRLKNINNDLYIACRSVVEDNKKNAPLRGGYTTSKKWEMYRNEKAKSEQLSSVNSSSNNDISNTKAVVANN